MNAVNFDILGTFISFKTFTTGGGRGVTMILNVKVAVYLFGLSSVSIIFTSYSPGSVKLDFG